MRLPRFPLESVASMRRHEEERALEVLAGALREEQVQERIWERLRQRWGEAANEMRSRQEEPAYCWAQGHGWREVLERQIEEQRRRLELARQRTEQARQRWMEARQRREILDKLRVRHEEEAKLEMRRVEQRDLDEMGGRKRLAWSVLKEGVETDPPAPGA